MKHDILVISSRSELHDMSVTKNRGSADETWLFASVQSGRKLQGNPVHNYNATEMLES